MRRERKKGAILSTSPYVIEFVTNERLKWSFCEPAGFGINLLSSSSSALSAAQHYIFMRMRPWICRILIVAAIIFLVFEHQRRYARRDLCSSFGHSHSTRHTFFFLNFSISHHHHHHQLLLLLLRIHESEPGLNCWGSHAKYD